MNTNFLIFAAALAVVTVLSVTPWGDDRISVGSSLWNDSRIAEDTAFATTAPEEATSPEFRRWLE